MADREKKLVVHFQENSQNRPVVDKNLNDLKLNNSVFLKFLLRSIDSLLLTSEAKLQGVKNFF